MSLKWLLKNISTLAAVHQYYHTCRFKVVLENRSSLSSKDGSWAFTWCIFLVVGSEFHSIHGRM